MLCVWLLSSSARDKVKVGTRLNQRTLALLDNHWIKAALLCLVVLLGFIDDVIDLKWRHKFIVPTIASVPVLVAYKGLTCVVVPKLLRGMIGAQLVDVEFIYYIYMGMLAIFCTNSINIYAGLNGLEVGQSIVIAFFVLMHNIIVSKALAS